MRTVAWRTSPMATAVFPELVQRMEPKTPADADARAHALVAGAERQAQSLMESARQKAAGLVDEARREGMLQGRAEALVESRKALEDLLRGLTAARDRLHGLEAEWRTRAEELVVSLALAVAQRILHAEIARDPAAIQRLAAAAVAVLPRGGEITIRVHPDSAAVLEAYRETLTDGAREHTAVRVVGDGALAPGDCLVETPHCVVDATFAAQVEEARRRLLELPW